MIASGSLLAAVGSGGLAFASAVAIAYSLRQLWVLDETAPVEPNSTSETTAGLRPLWAGRSTRSVRRQQQRQVPHLANALARSLRSGATIPGALTEAGTTQAASAFRHGLTEVIEQWEGGLPLVDALEGWLDHHPAEGLDLIVRALVLGFDGGGDRAQVLDAVATTLADRLALADEITALTSQARSSAMLITAAPALLSAVFLSLDPGLVPVVLNSPIGRVSLLAGGAFALLNWWWMSVIVRRVLR